MTLRGVGAVAGVECSKLARQFKTRLVLAACVICPFVFAGVMLVQSSLPEDTLFGRSVKESGFAASLVVLGFAGLWAFPAVTSVVGGDVFSSEDRDATWATILTRSRSRTDVFAGKVVTALGFSLLTVGTLALGSLAAGLLAFGHEPLIGLSGALLPPGRAFERVALAWLSVLPPAFAFTAVAVLLSVATRSSVAGIGLPIIAGLMMQLYALVDGPDAIRHLLITSAFGAWHGLVTEPPFYRPLVYSTTISAVYIVVCLACAYRTLRRRDIGG